ncbi:MAG TPA: hypothetical protein VE201_08005 [Nitrospirales bacterium]|nr:hypothetical protein [Nitrospirales bacterium]
MIAYDTIAAPGQRVTLVAELLEDGLLTHPPLGGEVLLFKEGRRLLGRAMTGGDGRALLSVVPRQVGASTVVVGLAESPRVTASDATTRLFVWDRRRAIVLVSLNAVVARSQPPGLELPLQRSVATLPAPEAGAVQALKQLERRAYLIYMTGRDRLELPELREWTELHRLPRGPIILLRPGPMSWARELERWHREGWTNIRGGIVETAEEAKALTDTKRKAVAAPTVASQEKFPEKTVRPKDWSEVAQQFR